MSLKFVIHNQALKAIIPKVVVSNTVNYFECEFAFQTADWDGLDKYAHFRKDVISYDFSITNNRIEQSAGLNLSAGVWKVYITGGEYDVNGTLITRITTAETAITVISTGAESTGTILPEIAPDVAEQLSAKIAALELDYAGLSTIESDLSIAEAERKAAELERKSAETSRDEAESARESAEVIRISNEVSRVEAENQRAAAESARASEYSEFVQEITSQTNAAYQSMERAENAASTAKESAASAAESAEIAAQYGREVESYVGDENWLYPIEEDGILYMVMADSFKGAVFDITANGILEVTV